VRKRAFLATLAATAAAAFVVHALPAQAARTETMAQRPVKALPPGRVLDAGEAPERGTFLSIIDLRQPAGASLGPHGHVSGFVYVLSGEATTVGDGSSTILTRGEAQHIPLLAAHTHKNSDDRLPAAALAIGLVVAVIALLLAASLRRAPVVIVPVMLAVLTAGGAVALQNPWENDWFFIAMRPESARGAPMPIPSASRTYESPEFSNVPGGPPWVESLATTTVDPHGQAAASKAPGPVVFLVLDGRAEVIVGNEAPIRLAHHQATLVQAGESSRVLNPSGATLRLLRFGLTPKSNLP
jgi:quercetin dioxygenase-like cupin family protein